MEMGAADSHPLRRTEASSGCVAVRSWPSMCFALGFVETPAVGFDALYRSFVSFVMALPKRC